MWGPQIQCYLFFCVFTWRSTSLLYVRFSRGSLNSADVPCSLDRYRRLTSRVKSYRTFLLVFTWLHLNPGNLDDIFLRNVGLSPKYAALQPRRPYPWTSLLEANIVSMFSLLLYIKTNLVWSCGSCRGWREMGWRSGVSIFHKGPEVAPSPTHNNWHGYRAHCKVSLGPPLLLGKVPGVSPSSQIPDFVFFHPATPCHTLLTDHPGLWGAADDLSANSIIFIIIIVF